MKLVLSDGTVVEPPKYRVCRYELPLREYASSPGGGGWGSPLDRDPMAVLRDVRDGTVSRHAARDIYGVVIADDGRSLDTAATERQRAALR
jgi:N-methylhydantoinase B